MTEVPDLAPETTLTLPESVEKTLGNGLTVIAVHRPSVPLVELRLRLPFAQADTAISSVLTQTLFAGTAGKSMVDIAAELQAVGGGLSAGGDPDRLLIAGNSLADGLPHMLRILNEVLTGAVYPANEVRTERERIADRLKVAAQQPAHVVARALNRRLYGDHPYASQTPEAEDVLAVETGVLRAMHDERLHPNGGVLVLVGDVEPHTAIAAVEEALGGWNGAGTLIELPPVAPFVTGPLTLVDRPGSVQSNIRLAMNGVSRTHADNAAQQLTNLVYGGYFSSRLVENIREDKGYTYSPRSGVEHSAAGTELSISADVATEVTAPALWETLYEMGRLATVAPGKEEVEQARRYALGTLRLGTSTQSGLAGLVSVLAGSGLRLDWLAGHATRLAETTVDDVARFAAANFAPANAVAVILGDAQVITPSLRAITAIEAA
nr:pitrilysin family protein [Actinorhabdospora filicis]